MNSLLNRSEQSYFALAVEKLELDSVKAFVQFDFDMFIKNKHFELKYLDSFWHHGIQLTAEAKANTDQATDAYEEIIALEFELWHLLFDLCLEKRPVFESIAGIEQSLVERIGSEFNHYKTLTKQLAANEDLNEHRDKVEHRVHSSNQLLGLLLDLVGWSDVIGAVTPIFSEILEGSEERLKFFVTCSQIRANCAVPEAQILAFAESDEWRLKCYERFSSLDCLDRFPKAQATMPLLAQSCLVNWLQFPTELDSKPDHIELMLETTVDHRAEEENGRYFVFRFCVDAPHWAAKDGWMAGIVGPLRFDEQQCPSFPKVFSCFDSWDLQSPKEHLASILGRTS